VSKPGRNDPCPCGSGKKFKKCCLGRLAPEAECVHDPVVSGEPVAFFDDIDRISNQVPDLIRKGRLDEAEKVCQRLIDEFPDEPDGRERQAEVEEARGNWKRAAALYRAVAAFHRKNDPKYGHEPAERYLGMAKVLETAHREVGDAPQAEDA